jgi:predicted small metal-binding protein
MSKVVYCSKLNPSADCNHVVRGETVEEVLQNAGIHAKEHGLEPTPELIEKVKKAIEEE